MGDPVTSGYVCLHVFILHVFSHRPRLSGWEILLKSTGSKSTTHQLLSTKKRYVFS